MKSRTRAAVRLSLTAAVVTLTCVGAFVLGSHTGGAPQGEPLDDARIAHALFQEASDDMGASEDYAIFTHSRYAWVVHKPSGRLRHFRLPEIVDEIDRVERSEIHQIDTEQFPLDRVQFRISDRNLKDYLWVFDPTNGRGRFLSARRDGGIDMSPIFDANLAPSE